MENNKEEKVSARELSPQELDQVSGGAGSKREPMFKIGRRVFWPKEARMACYGCGDQERCGVVQDFDPDRLVYTIAEDRCENPGRLVKVREDRLDYE